eukprot:RCo043328
MLTVYDPAIGGRLTLKNCGRLKRSETARAARPCPWEADIPRKPQGILTIPSRMTDSVDLSNSSVLSPAATPKVQGTRQGYRALKAAHLSGGCVDLTSKVYTPPAPGTVSRRFPRPKPQTEKAPRKPVTRPWSAPNHGPDRDQLDDRRVAIVKRSNAKRDEELTKTRATVRQTFGLRAPKVDVQKALRQPFGTSLNPELNLPLRKWCRYFDTRQLLHWRS